MMLPRDLARSQVLLVTWNELDRRIEVLLRRREVFPVESLCAGEVSLLRLALLSCRGRLLRRGLICLRRLGFGT